MALTPVNTEVVDLDKRPPIDYGDLAIKILNKFVDVLEAVAILVIGILVIRYLKRYIARIETKFERQRTALSLLEKILSGFILVVTVTLALKVVGLDLTLLVSIGVLGLSFGLRDVIKNYIAGILILFKAPFEIGEVVKIRSFTGKIERMDFQSTTIRTFEHKEVTIHNSDLLTQPIVNYSKNPERRLDITLRLGYGTDIKRALMIFDRVLQNHPMILKSPRYSIIFRSFENSGIDVLLRFWVERQSNPLRIRSDVALKIQEAFDEENIFAPYGREIQFTNDFTLTQDRRERIQRFRSEPALAEIMQKTSAELAALTNGAALEYADAEEPE